VGSSEEPGWECDLPIKIGAVADPLDPIQVILAWGTRV